METITEKQALKLTFNDYQIEVKQGKVEDFYCEDRKAYIFKSVISVNVNGNKTRFNFFGSINDFQNNKSIYDLQELAFCLYCFLSDSLAGQESFESFCSEFGYDNDSIKALKIHKACMRSTVKAEKLFNASDICEVLNHIQENYNC